MAGRKGPKTKVVRYSSYLDLKWGVNWHTKRGWRVAHQSGSISLFNAMGGKNVVVTYEKVDPAQAVAAPAAETKVCPDCAETILAAARVCRFCGYRFAPAPGENA